MASVVSVTKTGTTDQRIAAPEPAAATPFFATLGSQSDLSPLILTHLSLATDQTSALPASKANSANATAADSLATPLFSGLIAAALREEQENQPSLSTTRPSKVATNAYGAVADRSWSEMARVSDVGDIQVPGLPRLQASGRLLDVVA